MLSKISRKVGEVKRDIYEMKNEIKKVQIPEDRQFLRRELEKVDDGLSKVIVDLKIIKIAIYDINNAI